MALIQGHGGVGVVEAVGPEVRRVRVGDRVCVSGTPQCGSCYQCLRGRPTCASSSAAIGADDLVAVADMRDGTPVYENSHIGGLAELMVTFEEWVVPVFTKATAADAGHGVQLRGRGGSRCHRRADAGARCSRGRRWPSSGCGPLGLSAVQGARIARRVHDHRHRSRSACAARWR